MKLEAGKKYRNRKGEVVEITWERPQPRGLYPFADIAGASYASDGTFDLDSPSCELDLIEEVDEMRPVNEWRVEAHDVPTLDDTRAKRFNSGKVPMHYVPLDMLQGLARVLEDGAVKYGNDNWRLGAPATEQIDSLLRHLSKLQSGEVLDEESTLPHVDHMIFNCISLRLALEKEGKIGKDPGPGSRVKGTK
jgi:hypothetical protein